MSLSTCVDIAPSGDAVVSNPPMTKNFGTLPILRVGGKDEALVRFDLGGIPEASVIESATLQVFVVASDDSAPVYLHRATAPWNESTVTFAGFGQAFDPSPIAGFETTSTNVKKNIDITQQLNSWLTGAQLNHGLVLASASNGKSVIVSREGGTAAQRPQLHVCYSQQVDHCAANPCQNSGTCENTGTSYTCHCRPGFGGSNCEIDIDDCAWSPCLHGTCVDGADNFTCACEAGYAGTHCETNVDDCASAPCENGGVCEDGIATYTCHCLPGFTGAQCETQIDSCAANPCQNGGTCANSGTAYTCSCPTGFTGNNCEINVDDCASQPCLNGGSCIDGIASFACTCPPDWGGASCEINLNTCGQHPCLNGATCANGAGTYACTCAAGYAGANCEIDVNDCADAPCQNGGACIDGVDEYHCTCSPAYEGDNCELPRSWQNVVNASAAGDDVAKSAVSDPGWDAGATSVGSIAPGQDGYMEFTAVDTATHRMAGLGAADVDQHYVDIEFAISLDASGGLSVYEAGACRGYFGTYHAGDRMRVEVIGGQVRYLRNGVVFYVSTQPVPTEPLHIDSSLYSAGATITDALITACTAVDASCHRALTWINGSSVSADADGDGLTHDGQSSGWYAGASSAESISCGHGYAAFVATETTSDRAIGLGTSDTSTNNLDIEYGIYLAANGGFSILESGASRGIFGSYATGDVFQVEIDLPTVRYRRNSMVFYSSTVPASILGSYTVDASFFTAGSTIDGVVLVDADAGGDSTCGAAAFWANVHADTVAKSTSLLRASGIAAWNTGASSIASIAPGKDGHMEFTAVETGTYRMAGLGAVDVDQSYADIEFAIFLDPSGFVSVYESGAYRGNFGAYHAGDRMRVEVSGGKVRYLRNGVAFYTSGEPLPAEPLHIDTSLYSAGATITDAVITPD